MAKIRTSDRLTYRRCRRKFVLSSGMRMNLESVTATPVQFWLGSGVHFALEDFHGYNKFGNPHAAFDAYVNATYGQRMLMDKDAYEEAYRLGHGMLDNYIDWLPGLKGFETLWVDGVPMCEVRLLIDMPELGEGEHQYSATIDRIVKDENGRIWLVDYKTAKTINQEKLPLDTQITAYHWAVWKQYGFIPEGMIYIQMLKAVPDAPTELKSGGFSKAKNQSTNYRMYRKALEEKFGTVPAEYKEHLKFLRQESGFLDNKYVRVDFVRRNEHQLAAEGRKIVAEGREMLSKETVMYPNPTKDCSWDCSFKQVCIAMDDGSDWKAMLAANFRKQHPEDDSWRDRIMWPGNREGKSIEEQGRELLGL